MPARQTTDFKSLPSHRPGCHKAGAPSKRSHLDPTVPPPRQRAARPARLSFPDCNAAALGLSQGPGRMPPRTKPLDDETNACLDANRRVVSRPDGVRAIPAAEERPTRNLPTPPTAAASVAARLSATDAGSPPQAPTLSDNGVALTSHPPDCGVTAPFILRASLWQM